MKSHPSLSALAVALGICFGVLQGDVLDARAVADEKPDIAGWIEQLADKSFSVRETATHLLWVNGRQALPALRKTANARNPEQSFRAKELVRKIDMDIFPDTDQALIDIIEQYPAASHKEKQQMISDLREMAAWRQLLKLYESESDPLIRAQYLNPMQQIAVYAAREKIVDGDADAALELLELAPVSQASLLALAEFHRTHGSIQRELERAKKQSGVKAAAWRLALYRALGDFRSAAAEANDAKQPLLAASMAALSGDPLPWLREMSTVEKRSRRNLNLQVRSAYATLAAQRWQGLELDHSLIEILHESLQGRNLQSRHGARMSMFMLGQLDVAEASLIKESKFKAMSHLLSLERVGEALKLLEVAGDEICTPEWVADYFAKLNVDELDDEPLAGPYQQLITMAGFLESRGMMDLATKCYLEPSLDFARLNEIQFLEFVGNLFNGSEAYFVAPLLACELGSAWAGDDPQRWDRLRIILFEHNETALAWWDTLAELDPETARKEQLLALMSLFRIGPNPENLRGRWIELVWNAMEELEGDKKQDLVKQITDLGFLTGDVNLSSRAWKLLTPELRSSYYWRQRAAFLSAEKKWDEVCQILLEQIELTKKNKASVNPAFYAYAAATLRKAGKEALASEYDQMVEKLALGDFGVAQQIGSAYAFGEDRNRAMKWWLRAVSHSNPSGSTFPTISGDFANKLLLDPDMWLVGAALSEISACSSVSGNYYNWQLPVAAMRDRLKADTMRALSMLKTDRRSALAILEGCHRNFFTDGALADFFFPALRKAGLIHEHDKWFAESWQALESVIREYPNSHNTRNTAAWLAARAQRKLAEAEGHLTLALKTRPEQAAYLDTMAEIHFARGNRRKAIEWSNKAIRHAPTDAELRQQNLHFRHDPLPPKRP